MPRTLTTDRGIELTVDDEVVGSGGESDVFMARPWALKRLKDRSTATHRIQNANRLIDRTPALMRHESARTLVMPVDTVSDAWGMPAVVLRAVPPEAVEGMSLVMPRSFEKLAPGQRGDLRSRCLIAARYCAALQAFHQAVPDAALPDAGLRNLLIDVGRKQPWLIDLDSALFADDTSTFASSLQFDAAELHTGARPSPISDRHLMGVTVHLLLLARHPYDGTRHDPPGGAAEADTRNFISDPIWSDEPGDSRNRPRPGSVKLNFGALVNGLFACVFSALSTPTTRPDGRTWAHHLTWLTDRLLRCSNPLCWWKETPWTGVESRPRCAACGCDAWGTSTAVALSFLDDNGEIVPGEVLILTSASTTLYERHTQRRPSRLHGVPTGRVRHRIIGTAVVAEVDGHKAVTLRPGAIATIGERTAHVSAWPSHLPTKPPSVQRSGG